MSTTTSGSSTSTPVNPLWDRPRGVFGMRARSVLSYSLVLACSYSITSQWQRVVEAVVSVVLPLGAAPDAGVLLLHAVAHTFAFTLIATAALRLRPSEDD